MSQRLMFLKRLYENLLDAGMTGGEAKQMIKPSIDRLSANDGEKRELMSAFNKWRIKEYPTEDDEPASIWDLDPVD